MNTKVSKLPSQIRSCMIYFLATAYSHLDVDVANNNHLMYEYIVIFLTRQIVWYCMALDNSSILQFTPSKNLRNKSGF